MLTLKLKQKWKFALVNRPNVAGRVIVANVSFGEESQSWVVVSPVRDGPTPHHFRLGPNQLGVVANQFGAEGRIAVRFEFRAFG